VFVEEQGFPPEFIVNDNDEQGVHLAAYDRGRMVALLSVHIHRPGAPTLVANGLADVDGLSVQLTKRLELASYRGSGITEVLGANVLRYAFETLRPRRIFLVLDGMHRKLRDHYNKVFMARELGEVGSGPAARLVLGLEDEPSLRTLYLRMRAMAESVHRRCPVLRAVAGPVPAGGRARRPAGGGAPDPREPLRRAAVAGGRAAAAGGPEPAAVRRAARSAGGHAVPPAPARLLDVGTGTGVYLALMLKEPALAGYEARGIEPSPQMLAYARFAYPEQDLVQAGAYATGRRTRASTWSPRTSCSSTCATPIWR
jgi:hypothetical protein